MRPAINHRPSAGSRLQALGLLAVAVVVGILIGVAGERMRVGERAPERRGFRRDSGMMPPPLRDIGLSETQRTQIREIFENRRSRTDSIMREVLPQIEFHLEDVRSEIADILTPDQLQKMHEEFEHIRSRRGDSTRSSGRRGFGRPDIQQNR